MIGYNYPLEGLLRPPFEFRPAVVIVASAMCITTWPRLFVQTPFSASCIAIVLCAYASWRIYHGFRILRYQENLKRLPRYVIRPDEIPQVPGLLFLGKGFLWTEKHTQRLTDTRRSENQKYLEHGPLFKLARATERRITPESWLYKTLRSPLWGKVPNPIAPLPDVGGDPALHGVEPQETEIGIPFSERPGHTLVLGTTRVGKTRLAEVLITQDIRSGGCVIVMDPKGDVELLIRMYVEALRCGRGDDFVFFHLGYPEHSFRHNPIGSFSRVTEPATRISNQLPNEGQSAAFREFVWRFTNVLFRAMVSLGIKPSYKELYQHAVHIDELAKRYMTAWLDREHPEWPELIDAVSEQERKAAEKQSQKTGRDAEALRLLAMIQSQNWHDPIVDGLASILVNDRSYFEKLVSSLYPLLEKLTTGKIAELLSPQYDNLDDHRPIFDWETVITRKQIVYVGLDALSDDDVAGAVGSAMFSDLVSIAGRIYKSGVGQGQHVKGPPSRIRFHGDEFSRLAGQEATPMLNMSGGAGFDMTLYTQTGSDIAVAMGNRDKAGQMIGNLNNLVMLRVQNEETAEYLTSKLPEVQVKYLTPETGTTDTNDPREFAEFGSTNKDRLTVTAVPMLTPTDLIKLPKGQAFLLTNGGQLSKIRLPLFDPSADDGFPRSVQEVADSLYARFGTRAIPLESLTVQGKGSGW